MVHARRGEAQAHLLVRTNGAADPVPPGWEAHPVSLEELALAYLREPGAAALPGPAAPAAREGEPSEVTQMTALTMPARPDEDAAPAAAAVAADGLGHLAAAPGRAGRRGRVSARWRCTCGSPACRCTTPTRPTATRPAHSPAAELHRQIRQRPRFWSASLLQAVPALIGAFVGAPVLARELETGTFRYAWTQGFGRWRWTLAKLVPLAVAVTAAAGAFSVLFSWYYQPFFAAGYAIPFAARVFDLRGVAFAAWTLAAFAIGALAGMLIRRVVPAIVATLAVYAGLAFATGAVLRQHYMTPLLTSNPNPPGSAWIVSQWWTKGGKFAFADHGSGIVQRRHAALRSAVGPVATVPRPARPRSASPSTATRSGPATSRPAGSGPSSGSRAAGCSRCRCCSSPSPSGWSAAARPDPAEPRHRPTLRGPGWWRRRLVLRHLSALREPELEHVNLRLKPWEAQ